jgi:hypothetical protein
MWHCQSILQQILNAAHDLNMFRVEEKDDSPYTFSLP